jgi:hypothetical protein
MLGFTRSWLWTFQFA